MPPLLLKKLHTIVLSVRINLLVLVVAVFLLDKIFSTLPLRFQHVKKKPFQSEEP